MRDASKHMQLHVAAVDPDICNCSPIFITAGSCLPAMAQWQKDRLSSDTNFKFSTVSSVERVVFILKMLTATWTEHEILSNSLTEHVLAD